MKKRKLTTTEKLLFMAPALLLLSPVVRYVLGVARRDTMDKEIYRYAESSSTNCGQVMDALNLNHRPEPAMACAVAAARNKKPFFARFNWPNGAGSSAWVGSSSGQLTTVEYEWKHQYHYQEWQALRVWRGKLVIGSQHGREEVIRDVATSRELEKKFQQ